MITKDQDSRSHPVLTGLAILVIGVLIGRLARPERWFAPGQPAETRGEPDISRLDPDPQKPSPALEHRQLQTLQFDLAPEHLAELLRQRDEALATGILVQAEDALVPATLTAQGETHAAAVRLKGDLLDHLDTDRWSLRVELEDGHLDGMQRFSLQHPKTRGYLWEWFALNVARKEGLLVPRCSFVQVVINGQSKGIYYLEEHFSKELLESQGRREGPIVKFDESVLWPLRNQHHFGHFGKDLASMGQFPGSQQAEIRAYGEKRLSDLPELSSQLAAATESMRDLKRLIVASSPTDRITRLQALRDLESRTVDSVVDCEIFARAYSLLNLLRAEHGLIWHNIRCYYNPITGLLEPVLFDTGAGSGTATGLPIALRSQGFIGELARSDHYYRNFFVELENWLRPGYVEELFEEFGKDLRRWEAALKKDGTLPAGQGVDFVRSRVEEQRIHLRKAVAPARIAGFASWLEPGESGGEIVVEAWATSRIPTIVQSFVFSNGVRISAGEVLQSTADERERSRVVFLPRDGRPLCFRFAADPRLLGLRNVEEIKTAIRTASSEVVAGKLKVALEYRLFAKHQMLGRDLRLLSVGPLGATPSKPAPPTLAAVLDRHSLLHYDTEADELFIPPGDHTVIGDLVLPRGMTLRLLPGVRLRFARDAALIAHGPLMFDGTPDQPVHLEGDTKDGWAGLVVLEASGPSRLRHVVIRGTRGIQRGGWVLTGGTTFYHSPLEMQDCQLQSSQAEDALNVFGCEMNLDRVEISDCRSDALDGDFVTGVVRSCSFRHCGSDALDFSGSDVKIQRCQFQAVGDKAISAGEETRLACTDCTVDGASTAVASKDLSRVRVRRLRGTGIENYGLTAYIKKPQYGPSSIDAADIDLQCARGLHLVQDLCELLLDGEPQPTHPIDVEDLYTRGILGK